MSFIVDIIEDIVDIVVGIIDLIVDIIEAVLDAIADLLGFGNEVVEFFEVHNQPLFSNTIVDQRLSKDMVASALYNDIDVTSAIMYNAIFGGSIPKSLKEFISYIEDGHYYTGFPEVESFINYVDDSEVADVLSTIHGTPVSLTNSLLGRLTIPTWIEWWLYTNKGYNLDTGYIGSDAIDYTNFVYNVSADNYTVPISGTATATTTVNTSAGVNTSSSAYVAPLLDNTDTVGVSDEVSIVLVAATTGVLPYTVPSKPTGAHIVSNYYLDSAPTTRLLFKYKVGEGTYPTLDTSEVNINISATALQTLPAVPLRVNNVNFTSSPNETQITELLATMKIDGEGALSAITQDYTGNMNDLDHIYVNFGIRMWDDTQGGLSYLFTLFENLHTSNAVTEAQYTSATGDKPYNNIIVTHDDYKYVFKYAYTTYVHHSLSAVIADSTLNGIYYSKSSHFDDSNLLIKPYYASSSKLLYKVQYQADDASEITDFLNGNGVVAPGSTTTEGLGKLQVTVRIAYSGIIYDSAGVDSGHTVAKPDLVYENNGGLRIVNVVNEETTQSQEITYYSIVANGLNAYTVRAPIAALRVVDTDTGKFKLVKFNLANKDDLMLPFFYGITPVTSTAALSSMWLASAHVSIYLAHYEVIENNFFKILIMIIIIVIIMIATGYIDPATFGTVSETVVVSGTAETGTVLVTNSFGVVSTQTVVGGVVTSSSVVWASTMTNFAIGFAQNQLISYAITAVAEDISPELAMVLSVALQMNYGVGSNIDTSGALSIEDTLRITTIVVDAYSGVETITVNQEFEEEERIRQAFSTKLDTAYKALDDVYAEITDILDLGGHIIPGLEGDTRGYIVPGHSEHFYTRSLGTIEMNTHLYEFDHKLNQQYSFNVQYRQV
jgi:hypothetical protein